MSLDVAGRRVVGGDRDHVVGQPQCLDDRTEVEAVDRLHAGGLALRVAVVSEKVGALEMDVEATVVLERR